MLSQLSRANCRPLLMWGCPISALGKLPRRCRGAKPSASNCRGNSLHHLRDQGNTIVVIEHNLDVIKTADWLVDLGPEGGSGGGQIIAQGTPEQVAGDTNSHTGSFLKKVL